MIIIQKDINVEKVLGFQNLHENVEYRMLNYVIKCSMNDGILIFNTLTRGLIYISLEEKDADSVKQYLIEHWYMVTKEFDDDKFFHQYTDFCKLLTPRTENITSYVIFTTTDCNARCFYCFEKGANRMNMDSKTAEDVADYIISHCGGETVSLKWFGGEPLYNRDVIDIIIDKLNEAHISFKSSMNSNGYLFDEKMIDDAVNKWNLKTCTITLDGTEKKYNRIKAYIYKDNNAFQRVLHNISLLVENKVWVTIRFNVHSENMDDLLQLVNQLNVFFQDKRYIYIDPHPIYINTGTKRDETLNMRKSINEYTLMLNKTVSQFGFQNKGFVKDKVLLNKCMADGDVGIGIMPNGDICKCEHFEGNIVGSIYSEKVDTEVLNKCREKVPDYPECKYCAYRPECIQLKVCPANIECSDYWRARRYLRTRQLMLNSYLRYIKKNSEPISEENYEIEIQC